MEGADDRIREFWDGRVESYKADEILTAPVGHVVHNLALSHESVRILDVGCGTGLTALDNLVRNPNKFVFYGVDLSPNMIKAARIRFNSTQGINIEAEILEEGKIVDVEGDVRRAVKEEKPIVNFIVGNSQKLPFEDEVFDSYTSNLVIMIVPDTLAMLREAFRVTKVGARACFSAWDLPTKSPFFALIPKVLAQYGIQMPKGGPDNFAFARNLDDIKEKILEIGFKLVKVNYQDAVITEYEFQKLWLHFKRDSHFSKILQSLDEELEKKVHDGFIAECEEHFGKVQKMPTWSNIIVLAIK